MKFIQAAFILSVFASSMVAFAGDEGDICGPVFKACAAQGFAKDDIAPVGKKIWLNCADLILNQKKSVDQVEIDPKGFDATNCRDYRKAKEKFDANWVKQHPRK